MLIYPLLDPYAVRQDGTTPLTGDWDAGSFDITLDGDFIPGTSELYNLGTSDDIWDNVYCVNVEAKRDITLSGGVDSDILFISGGTTWFRIEPKNAQGDMQFKTPEGTELCFSIANDEVMKLDSSGNLFIDGLLYTGSPVRILEAVQIQDDLAGTNYMLINHNSITSNTGAISFGDDTINASAGKVRVRDNATTEPTSEDDGYIGVAKVGGHPRIYFAVEGVMYHVDGEEPAAAIIAGNPFGAWLFYFTYAA